MTSETTTASDGTTTSANAGANAWEEALIADLRANGGRPSSGPLQGHPLILLYTTGAKSGERRRSILTTSDDGDDLVVAATAGGSPTHPAWYRNVLADPNVTIESGTDVHEATAEVAEGAERDRLWASHVAQRPWFADYPAQVGGREIPVVRLRRR